MVVVDTNIGGSDLGTATWPAAHVSARRLDSLGALGIFVATSGSARAVEEARTLLETAYPDASGQATLKACLRRRPHASRARRPSVGNGSGAQAPAADALPAHDRRRATSGS